MRFTTPSRRAGWWELGKRFILFWSFNWDACKVWGYVGKDPWAPYLWRFYLGPLCLARVVAHGGRKLSRQERRRLELKARKRLKKLLGEDWK